MLPLALAFLVITAILLLYAAGLASSDRYGGIFASHKKYKDACDEVNEKVQINSVDGTPCGIMSSDQTCRKGVMKNGSCSAPAQGPGTLLVFIIAIVSFVVGVALFFV